MYGRIMELPLEDMRRQFDVNYWGQVYGSRAAVRYLRTRGGALINVGSALSDRAIPLQGNYCAAKHALKAFTDALRMELEEEGAPISVTLVKPASIDTPFFEKARTYLGVEPQPVPPVYAPEVVAQRHPARGAAPAARADRRRAGCQAERGAVRAAAGRPVHGTLDVRLAADRHRRRHRAAATTSTLRWRRRRRARPDLVGPYARVRASIRSDAAPGGRGGNRGRDCRAGGNRLADFRRAAAPAGLSSCEPGIWVILSQSRFPRSPYL